MNDKNFDWDDLRLFLAVAREGGLAPAAVVTGKSAPTLGRRMLAFERQLGKELFERLPRGYELTAHGQALLDQAIHIEQNIAPILPCSDENTVRRVKISAGTWVTHFMSQRVSQLLSDESIVLQFIAADQVLDIAHREAVIGIRNQRPTQAALAARRTANIRFAVYAATENIERWACVLSDTPSAKWVHTKRHTSNYIEVSNPRNALDMALAGEVRAVLPTFVGDSTEGLIKISDDIEELEHWQWLVTHQEDRHLPEVRTVIDRLVELLTTS